MLLLRAVFVSRISPVLGLDGHMISLSLYDPLLSDYDFSIFVCFVSKGFYNFFKRELESGSSPKGYSPS